MVEVLLGRPKELAPGRRAVTRMRSQALRSRGSVPSAAGGGHAGRLDPRVELAASTGQPASCARRIRARAA